MFGFIYSTVVVLMNSVLIPDMLDLSEFEYYMKLSQTGQVYGMKLISTFYMESNVRQS